MPHLFTQLFNDEAGFILSAELVLVATIAVLAMVVGLSEVSVAVTAELNDVAAAFGCVNQSFRNSGVCSGKGQTSGNKFWDSEPDLCDSANDISLVGGSGEQ